MPAQTQNTTTQHDHPPYVCNLVLQYGIMERQRAKIPIFSRMAQLDNNRTILRDLAHSNNWHIHKFLLKPFQFLYLNFKAVIIKGVFSKVIPNSYVFILGNSTSLRDFSLRIIPPFWDVSA